MTVENATPFFRDIRRLTSSQVTLNLPPEFERQTVEILVIPVEASEAARLIPGHVWPPGFFERFMGSIPDFPERESQPPLEERELLP